MFLDAIMAPTVNRANLQFQAFCGGIPYRLVKLQAFQRGMIYRVLQRNL
jgi:hypothetical protein